MVRYACLFLVMLTSHVTQPQTEASQPRGSVSQPNALLKQLLDKITLEQAQEDTPFVPFEHFHRRKGVYGSYIKQNFHGDDEMAAARRILSCYDNNMFATAWVTSSLVESYLLNGGPKPSEDQLVSAVTSLADHHDRNTPHASSVMNFWEQRYNANTSSYQSYPYNLEQIFVYAEKMNMTEIEALLKDLGLGKLAQDIAQILRNKDAYLKSFHLPPDFDDTFVNLGLGSLLYESRYDFPNAWSIWRKQNTNLTSVFDALEKYAYRPFVNDTNVNLLDVRTYYWIRTFLEDANKENKNVTLVPTWVQNVEELKTGYAKGVIMPHNINNVDATVAANTVFGITSAVLTGLVNASILDKPAIESIYHNTSALLAYEINTNLTSRPDLALLYYPSRMEYYWFVSRTFSTLDVYKQRFELPRPVMTKVWEMLKICLESSMTKYVLSARQSDDENGFYFDDFLGDGDITKDNKTLVRAEDRIFTTAMATNALLYTWSSYNHTSRSHIWRPDTPKEVVKTTTGCLKWLSTNVLGRNFDPWNAFFSGSWKGMSTLSTQYPGNVFQFVNGTNINNWDHLPKEPYIWGLSGFMDEQSYGSRLNQPHFGHYATWDFHGYNAYSGYFPLWSSAAYTYSTSLIAFSRAQNLTFM